MGRGVWDVGRGAVARVGVVARAGAVARVGALARVVHQQRDELSVDLTTQTDCGEPFAWSGPRAGLGTWGRTEVFTES